MTSLDGINGPSIETLLRGETTRSNRMNFRLTSAQFTRRNWNLRTLPHHLLKCVISTLISRLAKTHPSVSASTIRERTLHFALSTFLIWTATFPPILLTVFIHLFQLRLLQRRMTHDPFFIARGALLYQV